MATNKITGPIVLIEGLDLAGKSTLVNFLREYLTKYYSKVRYSRNSLVEQNPFADFADTERKKPEIPINETCSLFISAHLFDASHFVAPKLGEIHLQDSSWLRTLAFNIIRENMKFLPLLHIVASYQPSFDLILYLTANIETRQKRVLQREFKSPEQNDHSDYLVQSDPDLFKKNDEMLLATAQDKCLVVEVIDTSSLTPEQVQMEAWSLFQKYNII